MNNTRNRVRLTVDGRDIDAKNNRTLLQACLENGIYIPNLCYLEGMKDPPASCRLCFVEIKGLEGPVTSCTVRVREGMTVKTGTPAVRRLQRAALRLLLSAHEVNCGHCHANKKCELQRIALFLKVGLKPKRLEQKRKETAGDENRPFLRYFPNLCVLCGKCIYVCQEKHGKPFLTFAHRGFDLTISLYGEKDSSLSPCKEFFPCIEVCPVGALVLNNHCPPKKKDPTGCV